MQPRGRVSNIGTLETQRLSVVLFKLMDLEHVLLLTPGVKSHQIKVFFFINSVHFGADVSFQVPSFILLRVFYRNLYVHCFFIMLPC